MIVVCFNNKYTNSYADTLFIINTYYKATCQEHLLPIFSKSFHLFCLQSSILFFSYNFNDNLKELVSLFLKSFHTLLALQISHQTSQTNLSLRALPQCSGRPKAGGEEPPTRLPSPLVSRELVRLTLTVTVATAAPNTATTSSLLQGG